MYYAKWKLHWENNAGYGPESDIVNLGYSCIASQFAEFDDLSGFILGYTDGLFDVEFLERFAFEFLSETEALAFAKSINTNAVLMDDGTLAILIAEI